MRDLIRIALQEDGRALYFEYGEETDLYAVEASDALQRIRNGALVETAIPVLDGSHLHYEGSDHIFFSKT